MTEFQTKAEEKIAEVIERTQKYYTSYREYHVGGQVYSLFQKMSIDTQKSFFGVRMGKEKTVFSSEYCYFVVEETLTEALLQEYLKQLDTRTEIDVDCKNELHQYTTMSLIILTEDFTDKKMQKLVKKYKNTKHYQKLEGEYGWHNCQICVLDLRARKTYHNVSGDVLANRIGN